MGEGGTGGGAQLANYSLLGKTGTAVRFEGGRYVTGEYTASFAALFPADNPQLVVVVKIDNPTGKYYGGLTAAPVTRTMLQQALASRRVAIDRSRLTPRDSTFHRLPEPAATPAGLPRVVLSWPYQPDRLSAGSRPVPEVSGPTGPGGSPGASPARISGEPPGLGAGEPYAARRRRNRQRREQP